MTKASNAAAAAISYIHYAVTHTVQGFRFSQWIERMKNQSFFSIPFSFSTEILYSAFRTGNKLVWNKNKQTKKKKQVIIITIRKKMIMKKASETRGVEDGGWMWRWKWKSVQEKVEKEKRDKWWKSQAYIIMIHEMNAWPFKSTITTTAWATLSYWNFCWFGSVTCVFPSRCVMVYGMLLLFCCCFYFSLFWFALYLDLLLLLWVCWLISIVLIAATTSTIAADAVTQSLVFAAFIVYQN